MNGSSANEPINSEDKMSCPSEENTINNDNKYPSDNTNNDKNIKNNDDSPQDERSCPARWFYVDPLRFIRIILTLIALILYVNATTKKSFVTIDGNFDTTEPVQSNGGSGKASATAAATIEIYFIKLKLCIEADVKVKADKSETMNNQVQEEIDKETAKHNMKIDYECKEIMFNDIPDQLTLGEKTFDLQKITKDIKDPMNSIYSTAITFSIIIGVVLIIYILSIIRTLVTDVLGILASIVTFFCALVSLVFGIFIIVISKLPFDDMANEKSNSQISKDAPIKEPNVKTKIEPKNSVAAMLIIAGLMLGCVSFCCCICCLCFRKSCCCCCRKESCLDPNDDDTKDER